MKLNVTLCLQCNWLSKLIKSVKLIFPRCGSVHTACCISITWKHARSCSAAIDTELACCYFSVVWLSVGNCCPLSVFAFTLNAFDDTEGMWVHVGSVTHSISDVAESCGSVTDCVSWRLGCETAVSSMPLTSVSEQPRLLCEVSPIGLSRFLSTVNSVVTDNVTRRSKSFTANTTFIRFLACVSSPVHGQITGTVEPLVTVCALCTSLLWQLTACLRVLKSQCFQLWKTFRIMFLKIIIFRSQPVQLWSKWSTCGLSACHGVLLARTLVSNDRTLCWSVTIWSGRPQGQKWTWGRGWICHNFVDIFYGWHRIQFPALVSTMLG